MYCSVPKQLFQDEPEYGKRICGREPHGWTTLRGYWREASKQCQLLDLNRSLRGKLYTWGVSLNIEHALEIAEVKRVWEHVSRELRRRDVVAFWVREPSPANHCNYHLLIASDHTKLELRDAIDASIPDGIQYHKQIDAIASQWSYTRYIVKAKVRGYVGGKFRLDRYADKRLLFIKKSGLQKHGIIGSFWVRPKGELWQTVIAREKRIADGLTSPEVRAEVERLYELLDGTASRRRIERSLGFHGGTVATP